MLFKPSNLNVLIIKVYLDYIGQLHVETHLPLFCESQNRDGRIKLTETFRASRIDIGYKRTQRKSDKCSSKTRLQIKLLVISTTIKMCWLTTAISLLIMSTYISLLYSHLTIYFHLAELDYFATSLPATTFFLHHHGYLTFVYLFVLNNFLY